MVSQGTFVLSNSNRPHLRHTVTSQRPWVWRPRAAPGQEPLLLKFWLTSSQHSPNSAACVSQGGRDRKDRGHPSRGAWEGPGGRRLSQGHIRGAEEGPPRTLITRKPAACLMRSHLEAFSPLGTSALSSFGEPLSQTVGFKSSVGAPEAWQGWTFESHQGPVQCLLLSFYNIFTRSYKRAQP